MRAKAYRHKIKELILEENLLLPDFQRDFVWKPQDQQLKLICSLFLDIPIGSILVLDKLENIGTRKLCYKKYKEESKELKVEHSKLLMDGQQRISSIKSIFSDLYKDDNVNWETINGDLYKHLKYRWFLNLSLNNELANDDLERKLQLLYDFYWNRKFEDYDIEDIEFFILNKKILSGNKEERWHPSQGINKVENYCVEENYLPLFFLLSNLSVFRSITRRISQNYIEFLIKEKQNQLVKEHCKKIKETFKIIADSVENKSKITDRIDTNVEQFFNDHVFSKEIYGVEYEKSQLNKAIVAFNTMNTGGISLGVFDIISAKYSKLNRGRLSEELLNNAESSLKTIEDQSVAKLIKEKFIIDDKDLIDKNVSDMYLNMLSLFSKDIQNREANSIAEFKLEWIKQKSLLKINAEEIRDYSKTAIESLILAFQFLIERCGVPSIKDIKYKLTVIPLAYNLYQNNNRENEEIKAKIEYSYWMSLFSGKYEKGQNAFSIDHLNNLIKFIKNSQNDQFKKYKKDLCNKKGYSDLQGFEAFYEDNSYSYSSNIGEYFLQFILSNAYKSNVDIFKHSKEKKIKIEHFENLHKDHIIPDSWIDSEDRSSPVHSVLNKFYSPSKRNQKRLNNPINQEIIKNSMNILCIDTQLNYSREEFNSECKIKKGFLTRRFNLFKDTIQKHLQDLENKWKD